jgi:hypothetical protein
MNEVRILQGKYSRVALYQDGRRRRRDMSIKAHVGRQGSLSIVPVFLV